MKIKGIKRGNQIELSQPIDIPDGTELLVEIDSNQLISPEERRKKLKEFFQIPLENREELAAVLTELEREQHSNK